MTQWGNFTFTIQSLGKVRLWACPPEGCGRIYLEGAEGKIRGTWYTAEKNETPDALG
jgi:hypothetical protein